MHRLSLFALLSFVLVRLPASAQDVNQLNKLHLAQEFENAGLWERAVSLYEELHRADRSNFVFFDGLQRGYLQLKEYDKAIALTHERLRFQPDDPGLLSAIAGMHFDTGREAAADSVWDSVLALNRDNVNVYQMVAMEMLNHRLYEKAIRTYLAGRAVSRSEATFSNELANLYSMLQQVPQATAEYLRRLRAFPDQLPFIESQLATVISRPPALQQAIAVASAEAERTPRDVAVRRFLAWLQAESREYDAAVREYEAIDALTGSNGGELFAYAQRLLQERANASAADAFLSIIRRSSNPSLVPQARYGYARAIEALSADSLVRAPLSRPQDRSIDSQPTSASALRLYESIAADYPETDLAGQSLFRIGILRYERFFDLNGAQSAFQQVKSVSRNPSLRLDASLKAGEVDVARNDLQGARGEYGAVAAQTIPTYRDQAAFRLAELDYFEARFDSSLSTLARFKTSVAADLANDALGLHYFIQENLGGIPRALTAFAEADLLLRQRKQSEALTRFQDIVTSYPNALLVDDALMKIGEIHAALGHSADAMATFQTVADSMPASIWKDRAQFRIGEIFDHMLNDRQRAVEAYERLLLKYPTSLSAEEARRRIRSLRGDRVR